MKKLIYIANVRMPTEKAHGLQIIKMSEAFARRGIKTKLVIPWRFNPIKKNPIDYYGAEKNFKIKKIPSLDLVKFGKIGFWIQSLSFSKFAAVYTLIKNPDIIYSRDAFSLFWLSFFKKNIFWETHKSEFNFLVKRLLKKCRGIIVITQNLKKFYVEKEANADKILVAPDGVDLEKFDIKISKEETREKLNLPQDKKIILYTGHLYDWKGAQTLAEASKFFGADVLFIFVGGTEKDVKKFKIHPACSGTKFKILVIGHRPHQEIPLWLKAADVLILPNSAKEKISKFYTSPLKLFEYMASGRPIVASDLPSIREILNENNAILVESDNPQSLAEGILRALKNPDFSDKMSKQAYLNVQNYTWQKRVGNIMNFINNENV